MPVEYQRIVEDIEKINSFNATPGKGITRITFSEEYQAARAWLSAEMEDLGMAVRTDGFGNLFGRLEGRQSSLPTIMAGSHLDTVANGGRFDGVVGVVAALETARCLVDEGRTLLHPYTVVVFAEEEGYRFGQVMAGSMAFAGMLSADELYSLRDRNSVSYAQAMDAAGLCRSGERLFAPADVKCMLEAHIEQGGVLESKGFALGVVEAIAGIHQFVVLLQGQSNHAGPTPMSMRADALCAAAEIITAVEKAGQTAGSDKTVCTVGRIVCKPNVSNIIPGSCEVVVDIRDPDSAVLGAMVDHVVKSCLAVANRRGVGIEIAPKTPVEPVQLSGRIGTMMAGAATKYGIPHMRMTSGALHDASVLAGSTETAMLFVPSRGGRSHVPEEYTSYEEIFQGVKVFADVIAALAQIHQST